ncbi:MAG TPA: DUF885 family protein, partial [Thermoanaerobaculia bacterium]|nr:DUF885 family protein [Thermoanaerobaculia bacterium]
RRDSPSPAPRGRGPGGGGAPQALLLLIARGVRRRGSWLPLRAYAQKELGDRFDVRAFHDPVLGNGSVPLDLLEANVKTWVAAQKDPKVERGDQPVGR